MLLKSFLVLRLFQLYAPHAPQHALPPVTCETDFCVFVKLTLHESTRATLRVRWDEGKLCCRKVGICVSWVEISTFFIISPQFSPGHQTEEGVHLIPLQCIVLKGLSWEQRHLLDPISRINAMLLEICKRMKSAPCFGFCVVWFESHEDRALPSCGFLILGI